MKYLVQVNYKSGNSVKCWFDEFKYTKTVSGSVSVKFKTSNPTELPIILGVDDIESIWQLEAKEG